MLQGDHLVVLTTCPDEGSAEGIARVLVEQGLAACVNILPKGRSIYKWRGLLETSEEHVLLIKTHAARYALLEQAIKTAHPYELPEIIAVPVVKGLSGYLSWIDEIIGEKIACK